MTSYIHKVGNQLMLTLDGVRYIAQPTNVDVWLLNAAEEGPGPGEPGDGIKVFNWPFPLSSVTSEYGPRDGRIHQGIDFGQALGTPVHASFEGVRANDGSTNFGNHVIIKHTIIDTRQLYTLYGHMRDAPLVPIGGAITTGQLIGYVNNTGSSKGNHLHWETHSANIGGGPTWSNPGTHINPRTFMDIYGVGSMFDPQAGHD